MNQSIRERMYNFFHVPTGRASRIFDGVIAFLIILSSASIPFYIIPYFSFVANELWYLEVFIVGFFTIEYFLRLWSAKSRIKYMFSFDGIIDFISIFPFFLEELNLIPHEFALLVAIRLLRILRIIKLVKMYEIERLAIANSSSVNHGVFRTLPGEKIDKIVMKHPIVFLISFAPVIFFVSLGLLILLTFSINFMVIGISTIFFITSGIIFLKNWIEFNYNVIYLTNKRLIIQKRHLFGANRNEIPYKAITHVHPHMSGIMRMLFKFGNLSIETAALKSIFTFVPKVENVADMITDKIAYMQDLEINGYKKNVPIKDNKKHKPKEEENMLDKRNIIPLEKDSFHHETRNSIKSTIYHIFNSKKK